MRVSLERLSELVVQDPEALQKRFGATPALVLRSPGAVGLNLEDTQADEDSPQWAELYRRDSAVIPLIKSRRNAFVGVIFVGRRGDSDIILRDPKVSKLHATLRQGQYGWLLQDKGSRNGTFLNQRRLEPNTEVEIAPGDELRFGDCRGVLADLGLLQTLCTYVRSQP